MMKKALFALLKYWLDVLLALVLFSIVAIAITLGSGSLFVFSIKTLPGIVLSLVPYASAAAMPFAYFRVSARVKNRAIGYLVLWCGAFFILATSALLTPMGWTSDAETHSERAVLPVHTMISYDNGLVWADSIDGEVLEGVVVIREGSQAPRISYRGRVPYNSKTGVLSDVGVLPEPEIPRTYGTVLIVDALDYEGTSVWWMTLGGRELDFSDRLIAACALALAFACLWPVSRIGSWPMVSFSLVSLALAGVFAVASVARSRPVASMLEYVDIRMSANMTVFACCTIVALTCVVFDVIFLKRLERR